MGSISVSNNVCTYCTIRILVPLQAYPTSKNRNEHINIRNRLWNAYSNSEDVRTGPGPTSDEWESTNLSFPSKGYGKWLWRESTRQYADHQNDLGNFSSLVYDLAFFNSVLVATFRWSPRHVARTQTAVPFLASGPTIYPSFGPRSGPTSAYPLNLVRQVGHP